METCAPILSGEKFRFSDAESQKLDFSLSAVFTCCSSSE